MVTPLDSVIELTQGDLENARKSLYDCAMDLAADLVKFACADLREPNPEVSLSGIVKAKGAEIDMLCARHATIKLALERLAWLKKKEAGNDHE